MDSGILKKDRFMLPARYARTEPIRKQVNLEKMRFLSALPADCCSDLQNAGVSAADQLLPLNVSDVGK